jgi:hypothetical protein
VVFSLVAFLYQFHSLFHAEACVCGVTSGDPHVLHSELQRTGGTPTLLWCWPRLERLASIARMARYFNSLLSIHLVIISS